MHTPPGTARATREEPLEDGPYVGVHDSASSDEIDSYVGEEVTRDAGVAGAGDGTPPA